MKRFVLILFLIVPQLLSAAGKSVTDSLLQQLDKASSSREKIIIYNALAKSFWYNSPAKTIEYGEKALALSIENENDSMIIDSRINIGIGYSDIADYANAMDQLVQSLSLSEKINYKSGIANSLSNIAIIYDNLGNYEKSKACYLKSLTIDKEINNDKGIIGALNNLGILCAKTKDYKKALSYYEEALAKEKAINEKQMIAITLANIGDVYDFNGDKKKAQEYYENSLKAGEDLKSNTLIITSLINIGRMNLANNKPDSAMIQYKKALLLSKDYGFKNFIKDIDKYLSELYEAEKNHLKALEYFKKYDALKDTLLSEESTNKITELQVKYETEAKQKENELLQEENKYQKGLSNFLILISLMVIIIAFLSYRSFRIKKKSNQLLIEKNEVITKQKDQLTESMIKLQTSEELYRSLVTTSPDGIAITDLKARLTFVSPALLAIYGFAETGAIIGKSALAFICKDDWQKAMHYFNQQSEGKISNVIELKGIRSDHSFIDIEINSGVLKNIEGKITGMFFMFRDITVRKKIEQENRQQQEMIFEQEQEISKLELLKKEQENINLKNDLEFRDKELASKAMYIIQNNERIDSVVGKLRDLEKKTEEKERITQTEIRSLINELRISIRRESWKEFETHFTNVHQSFYDNLLKKFPELSTNERKLCAFLRLNLSTKEISDITSKSIHSINVARTRLRQKLGIVNTDDNLSAFLAQF
jgi:PAS domain S-box-containing protein